MGFQHGAVAVDRDEVAGAQQADQIGLLFVMGVTRAVDGPHAVLNDLGAGAGDRVDNLAHRPLVAGDGRGAEHYLVAGLERNALPIGHAGQGSPRLSLGAGHRQDEAGLGLELELRLVADRRRVDAESAWAMADPQRTIEGGSRERQLASALLGRAGQALQAVKMGGEAGHHQPPLGLDGDLLELAGDRALGASASAALGVGGVGEEEIDALVADLLRAARRRW